MSLPDTKTRLFRRFSAVTVIAVYLLIAIGGIVRSTGSGMGCPDWPKCFGSWVPPTSVDELPADYKEDYVQQRVAKNEKFSKYLTAFGFDDLAYQVENDPKILVEEDFNAVKTWVEYINRLIGAVIGLLIFGTFVLSIRFWKKDRPITVLSFIAFVLVGFQGWIGSIVVSTNLLQWMITIHMLLAIVIVGLLIYVYFRSKRDSLKQLNDTPSKLKWIVIACLLLTIVQIVLGTQVREGVDMVAEFAARSEWISNLGLTFIIHRSYSLLLLALHGYLFYILLTSESLKSITKWLLVIVVMEILSGAIMAYFGVPAFIQPIHLLLGTLIVGVQYYLLLLINHKQRNIA
ncbi:MAG: cytochrome c oxidase assembly protein subunit 15 [Nonlabens sp.]|jgi:cytochrome c oxidase assembly protein subunit 15